MDIKTLEISGSIGFLKLNKNGKNIYIFYDDHSNDEYCETKNDIFINKLFENILNSNTKYIMLLEEPFVKSFSNIKFLWNNTPHIVKFRHFYKQIMSECGKCKKKCNVFPVDIRLIINDVAYDELINNMNDEDYFDDYQISTNKYFKYVICLFDYLDDADKIFDDNLLFIKKLFNIFNKSKYYKRLKKKFIIIYENYIKDDLNMEIKDFVRKNYNKQYDKIYNINPGYPFEKISDYTSFAYEYRNLLDGIMEFYIFILIEYYNINNIILYSGYYHSHNIAYILQKYFNYQKIFETGVIENIKNKTNVNNCLYIDKKIFN